MVCRGLREMQSCWRRTTRWEKKVEGAAEDEVENGLEMEELQQLVTVTTETVLRVEILGAAGQRLRPLWPGLWLGALPLMAVEALTRTTPSSFSGGRDPAATAGS
jgi:hypothetical protein